MATYTAIASIETDPGKPVKSDLMKRLVDNPIAAFDGDPSAVAAGVSLKTAALFRPTAGNIVTARGRNFSANSTTTDSLDTFSTIVTSATVRIGWTLTRTAGSGAVTMAVYKNGVLLTSTNTIGAGTIDISVVLGDIIHFVLVAASSTSALLSNISAMNATADISVV